MKIEAEIKLIEDGLMSTFKRLEADVVKGNRKHLELIQTVCRLSFNLGCLTAKKTYYENAELLKGKRFYGQE